MSAVFLGCLGCVSLILYWTGILKPAPAFVGDWETSAKVKIKVIMADDKEIDEEIPEAKLKITAERKGGFTGTIDLKVDGLPHGVAQCLPPLVQPPFG